MRVVTWNIWNGGEDRLGTIEYVLRAQDADAIALQEVTDPAPVAAIAERLGMTFTYGEANSPWGVAWLTRLPVLRWENHRLPQLAKTLLEVEVEGLRLYTTHLVHGRTEADAERRLEEARLISARLRAPCLLVGDFNAVHPQDEVGEPPPEERAPDDYVATRPIEQLLERGLVDCYRSLHDDRGWTYESWRPWFRPDYVFALGHEPQACEVVDAGRASDHLPVRADFS